MHLGASAGGHLRIAESSGHGELRSKPQPGLKQGGQLGYGLCQQCSCIREEKKHTRRNQLNISGQNQIWSLDHIFYTNAVVYVAYQTDWYRKTRRNI